MLTSSSSRGLVAEGGGAEGRPQGWNKETFASLLATFYCHIDPRIAGQAPRDAVTYFGREPEFFAELTARFGANPIDMLRERQGWRRATSTAAFSDAVVRRSGGDVDNGHTTVTIRCDDPSIRRRQASLEGKLETFYMQFAPHKVSHAPILAELFGGSDATEEALNERLRLQYGRDLSAIDQKLLEWPAEAEQDPDHVSPPPPPPPM